MKQAIVIGRRMWVPDNVAEWDAVAGDSPWERDRINSMLHTLKRGDVLFDVGAEHGWMSVIFARHVGGTNMVVAEPSPEFWPNIRLGWEHNGLEKPMAMWPGFVGDKIDFKGATGPLGIWPDCAFGPECDAMAYRSLKHHSWLIPTVTIDWLTEQATPPVGITIDVEGAELGVLAGASDTLTDHRPYVWCSVHPDLMERDFDACADQVQTFMLDLGYHGRLLAIDHEEHWAFWPDGADPL